MIDSAQKRGELIGHLEAALELADELNGGRTGFLIEQALDEARTCQARPLFSYCRFRKPYPIDSRSAANQNMIVAE